MKPFSQFVRASQDFAMYGTARAELLCACVAGVRVQTLVACICRSACAVAWRRRLPPSLESPPVLRLAFTKTALACFCPSVRALCEHGHGHGWSELCCAGVTIAEAVCAPRGTSLQRHGALGYGG